MMKRMTWSVAAVLAASAVWAQQATRPASTPAGAATTVPHKVDHDSALVHYQKAKDLFDKERYAEADAEVTAALTDDPDLQDAKLLRLRIDSQKPNTAGGTGAGAAGNAGLLTPEQISRVRLAELGSRETGLRGSIPRKSLEDFWADVILKDNTIPERDKTSTARSNFLNPSNFAGQLHLIQQEKGDKYLDAVKIDTDPDVLKTYKTNVQPFLLQNCASCHKPGSERKFIVFGATGQINDAQSYTNFFELATYTKDGAMIDRQDPEHSLLIQYCMPRRMPALRIPAMWKSPTSSSPIPRPTRIWWRGSSAGIPAAGIRHQVVPPMQRPSAPSPQIAASAFGIRHALTF